MLATVIASSGCFNRSYLFSIRYRQVAGITSDEERLQIRKDKRWLNLTIRQRAMRDIARFGWRISQPVVVPYPVWCCGRFRDNDLRCGDDATFRTIADDSRCRL